MIFNEVDDKGNTISYFLPSELSELEKMNITVVANNIPNDWDVLLDDYIKDYPPLANGSNDWDKGVSMTLAFRNVRLIASVQNEKGETEKKYKLINGNITVGHF